MASSRGRSDSGFLRSFTSASPIRSGLARLRVGHSDIVDSTPETACGAVTRVESASATECPVHRSRDRRSGRIIAAASGYFIDPPLNRMVVLSSTQSPHQAEGVLDPHLHLHRRGLG